MILRPAQSIEAPELVRIMVERHPDTRYADVCRIDEVLARKILAHAIHRHGGTNEGATFVNVAVDDDGQIAAFIFASLNRVYGVGDRLASGANYLLGRKHVRGFTLDRLFGRYLTWALENPKVAIIGGDWSTTLPGAERFAAVLERRGFEKIAETWELSADAMRARGMAA